MNNAQIIANEIILNSGNLEKFDNIYQGGISAESVDFGYKFAQATSLSAATLASAKFENYLKTTSDEENSIKTLKEKDNILIESSKKLVYAISKLTDDQFVFAIDWFKKYLSAVPNFQNTNGELSNESRKSIASAFSEEIEPKQRILLIRVLSDSDTSQPKQYKYK